MSKEGSRTSWDSQDHVGSSQHVVKIDLKGVWIYEQGEGEMMGTMGVARTLTIETIRENRRKIEAVRRDRRDAESPPKEDLSPRLQ